MGRRLAIGTMGVVVGVLGLEWALRARQPLAIPFHNELHPYVMFRAPGNVTWQSDGASPSSRAGVPAVEHTNQDGLRVPSAGYDVPRKKPPGQIRLAVLGGSTVRVGTTFDVTLPGALKRRLVADFPDLAIEVLNAGIISAISKQELVYLVTTLLDYELDAILVYDGINDSGQMLYFEQRPDVPYFFGALELAWARHVDDRQAPLWRLIPGRSAIAAALWPGRFGPRADVNPVAAEALIADAGRRATYAAAHGANWMRMHRIAGAYGIPTFFVLQPTSLYGPGGVAAEATGRSPELYANFLVYEALREDAGRVASAGVQVLDLADRWPDPRLYYDGAHVFDEVNDLIAGEIAGFLGPALPAAAGRASRR